MSSGKSRKSARAGKVPTRPSGGLIGEIEAYLRRSSAKPPLREDGEGLSRNCDEESDAEARSVQSGRDSSERGPEDVEQAESSSVEFVEKGARSASSVNSANRGVIHLDSDEEGEVPDDQRDRELDPFRRWSQRSPLAEPSDGGIPRVRSFREEQRYRDELSARASSERTSVIEEIFKAYRSPARRPAIGSKLRAALASPSEELKRLSLSFAAALFVAFVIASVNVEVCLDGVLNISENIIEAGSAAKVFYRGSEFPSGKGTRSRLSSLSS